MIRNDIITTLQQHHAMSASELIEKFKKLHPTVNKTTVYRALDQLEAESLVCKHNFDGRESVYEMRDHHHDHLFCMSCGKLLTTDCITVAMPKVIDGFTVDHHHLTYYGFCKNCAKA